MNMPWRERETGTYQDHVIAHVIGASVLGIFQWDGAVHLLLDIGFFWTIYADADMALVLERVAIGELEVADDVEEALLADAENLHEEGTGAENLKMMRPGPLDTPIREVLVYASGERRRVEVVAGDGRRLVIEGEPAKGAVVVVNEAGPVGDGE